MTAETNGRPVDREGHPATDPTVNVIELVEQAIRRQDDLRDQESKHSREIGDLRASHNKEIREAESARIDAIRAVDVGNVTRAAEVQATQAKTLEIQVATSAETLRKQVEATAIAARADQATALTPINKSIDELRQAQYQQQGERFQRIDQRDDPILKTLARLDKAIEEGTGRASAQRETHANRQWTTGQIIIALGVVGAWVSGLAYILIHH